MSIKQIFTYIFITSLVVFGTVACLSINNNALAACAGTETAVIDCSETEGSKDAIWSLLLTAITILTAGVGVVALGGIVYGAVLYTSAGGNPEQVKKAMGIFTNVSIGVIAFAGMYVLLNFIIPGGIFN